MKRCRICCDEIENDCVCQRCLFVVNRGKMCNNHIGWHLQVRNEKIIQHLIMTLDENKTFLHEVKPNQYDVYVGDDLVNAVMEGKLDNSGAYYSLLVFAAKELKKKWPLNA